MIYFDNAATSFPKPRYVIEEITRCLNEYCANPGRSGHKMSIESAKLVYETRERLGEYFNISDVNRIAFVKNATEGLNIAIKGVITKYSHVITTSMEHNSVIRPLKELEKAGMIELAIIKGNKDGEIDLNDIKKAINENTRLIAITLSSNVNGIVMPIEKIGKIAKENRVTYLVDASQGAGSLYLDVEKMKIDLLAFPGHKCLMGPQGIGGVYVAKNLKINSLIEGGTGTDSISLYQPEYMQEILESGTLNTPGIAGLNAGLKFINLIDRENIRFHKYELTKKTIEGLLNIKDVKVYSINDFNKNSGIVAFDIAGISANEIAYILDKNNEIAVRSGLHCAPLAHKTLGTTQKGLIRASFSYFNKKEEVDRFLKIIDNIIKNK